VFSPPARFSLERMILQPLVNGESSEPDLEKIEMNMNNINLYLDNNLNNCYNDCVNTKAAFVYSR
jgi:hypothetical protein